MNHQLRLAFYYNTVLSQIYSEGDSVYHEQITQDVIERYIDPLQLPTDADILDLGCGPGYFLHAMQQRGYTKLQGVTLSQDDLDLCRSRGLPAVLGDMNFLDARDETYQLLFCRHSLEHSPFPYITLMEYNRLLAHQGYLYVEVPQPDQDRPHEQNRNHYSIMGRAMWLSLLQRTGFDVCWYDYEVPIEMPDGTRYQERSYIFVCRRRRALDIK